MAEKKNKTVETAEAVDTAVETAAVGPAMITVKIPRTRKDQEDVFVAVNNRTYIIKRGVPVDVPDFVYEVLQHQEEMLEKIMLFDEQYAER